LRLADLIDDDKPFWKQYHKRQCPGMAEVDFDGSRNKYVGLALIRSEGDKTSERVVAVRINVGGLESRTIYDDFKAPPYTVVFQVGPGITWEWDQPNKKIRIPHDSLVAATIEAAAQQFYLKDGKFRYVQTSD